MKTDKEVANALAEHYANVSQLNFGRGDKHVRKKEKERTDVNCDQIFERTFTMSEREAAINMVKT